MFIVDTNVICESSKKLPDPTVTSWLKRQREIAISVISIQEIAFGIGLAPIGKQNLLREWFEDLITWPSVNLLSFDSQAARQAGVILSNRQLAGKPISIQDAQIAASAQRYSMVLATRNVKDFANLGIPLINPFVKH